jgi:DNA-directed RNA polymerase II subunit RPB1
MSMVWSFCKTKMTCEADEPKEENEGNDDDAKKGHGGCGAVQPQIRREGLKLFVQYKKSKDEDEVRVIVSLIGQADLLSQIIGDEISTT